MLTFWYPLFRVWSYYVTQKVPAEMQQLSKFHQRYFKVYKVKI